MLTFLLTVVKLLVILCIVATIHEFGHFLMSKLCKAKVNEFSIGFGPKIVQKQFGETMYSLRWLPLGGYCAIEGEDGDSEADNSFAKKNTLQKILILIMGATFNAILAVVIFVSIAFSTNTYTTKVLDVEDGSILANAGIESGDVITKVNSKKVNILSDIVNMAVPENKDVEVEYVRNGEKHVTTVNDAVTEIGYIGVSFSVDENSNVTNVVDMVASGSAAADSKLKAGDKIVSIDGIETSNASQVISYVRQNANKELSFVVERNGETIEEKVTPVAKKVFDLNITNAEYAKTNLKLAFASAYSNVKAIVGSYVDLFRGKVGVKDMSGIVGIGEVVSKTSGILEFLNLMGIISLAIGVANIMPFPPLDGGKIVIVIGEAITRKKLPIKAEAIISYIGFGLLIALTLVVTYNDIIRII